MKDLLQLINFDAVKLKEDGPPKNILDVFGESRDIDVRFRFQLPDPFGLLEIDGALAIPDADAITSMVDKDNPKYAEFAARVKTKQQQTRKFVFYPTWMKLESWTETDIRGEHEAYIPANMLTHWELDDSYANKLFVFTVDMK